MNEPNENQETRQGEEKLTEEFRNLGKNLMDAVRAAWESPERRKLQQEISSGINELGATIRSEAQDFSASETGQRIKSDVKEAQQRIRSGEVEAKVRDELLSALRTINTELQKVVDSWSATGSENTTPGGQNPSTTGGSPSAGAHQEIHPDDVESTVNKGTGHQEVHPDDVEFSNRARSSGGE